MPIRVKKKIKTDELKKRFRFNEKERSCTRVKPNTGLFKVVSPQEISCEQKDRAFLNGGWLEVLVADCLRGADFRDICQALKFPKAPNVITAKLAKKLMSWQCVKTSFISLSVKRLIGKRKNLKHRHPFINSVR